MFDIKSMSWEELDALQRAIQMEKADRDERRFIELAEAACDALNALKLEFPFVEFSQQIDCPDCDCCIDVNLFDHCDKFGVNMFSMG